jgi:hypothetical protein
MAVIRPLVQRKSDPSDESEPLQADFGFLTTPVRSKSGIEKSPRVDAELSYVIRLFDNTYYGITKSDASDPQQALR